MAFFQWGWARSVFGIESAPIEPFLPMILFAIVFGLSMDYEVFLLSRIHEEWVRTGDSRTSVADGLAATARVITAAAAIMVFVFGSFTLEDNRAVRLMGFGLAVAVFLDATVVRMLLVPATMELLGDRNWWLPRWLDRLIPHVNVEGGTEATTEALKGEGWPPDAPGGDGSGASRDEELEPSR
ncbi:MAG: MMPL family transporter [Microthrixaceae bacterium]